MNPEIQNLIDYSPVLAVIPVVVGGFWALLKYRESVKDKRFKTYHDLLDQLVNEQRNADRAIKLDRQVALIFELRNFPDYYPVTKRILEGLKKDWAAQTRAVAEINKTLEFLSKSWIEKSWIRFWKY